MTDGDMKLFLVRHAKAAKKSLGLPDCDRHLTPKGHADAFACAQKWKKKLLDVEVIVTSPCPRALETAEIFATVLGRKKAMIIDKQLDTQATPHDLIERLGPYAGKKAVMYVGHEPGLTGLASLLISGLQKTRMNLRKPGLIQIDVKELVPGGGVLCGFR